MHEKIHEIHKLPVFPTHGRRRKRRKEEQNYAYHTNRVTVTSNGVNSQTQQPNMQKNARMVHKQT